MINDVNYRQAHFLTSALTLAQCLPDIGAEVAFAGRSNAGKSSCLNTLTNNKKLAKTSKTPGRTQLINFFYLGEGFRLVDLPGYGYAKVAESIKKQWQWHLSEYLQKRQSLHGLVVIMDCRHPLQDTDVALMDWAARHSIPIHAVLTKADKLSKQKANLQCDIVRRALDSHGWEQASVQLFSSLKNQGIDVLRSRITALLTHGQL